jgi:glycosyltransferase involved in cell wall biosynthesis
VGGLRPAMMAKYLPEFGWTPYILTRDYGHDHACRNEKMHLEGLPDGDSVIRVQISAQDEREYLRRRGIHGQVRDFFQPERSHPPGEYDKMYHEATRRLNGRKLDAIWATAPGYAPIRLGRDLAEVFRVPWLADFRDIPEQEMGMPRILRGRLLVWRTIQRRKQLVSTAAVLTSVSPHHCLLLKTQLGKRCELLYNGYDHEAFTSEPPVATDRFRIVYTGRILSRWYQDPTLLFAALDGLFAAGQVDPGHVEVSFLGTDERIVAEIAGAYRSAQCIRNYGRLAYSEVPSVLRRACILLLLTNIGRKGILTTKLFEYLAMRRPILCVSAEIDDDIPVLLRETKSGVGTCSLEEIQRFILRLYHQWLADTMVPSMPDEPAIEVFSRKTQAERLAALLNEFTESLEVPEQRVLIQDMKDVH